MMDRSEGERSAVKSPLLRQKKRCIKSRTLEAEFLRNFVSSFWKELQRKSLRCGGRETARPRQENSL